MGKSEIARAKRSNDAKELSGPSWAKKFKGSIDTRDLTGNFRLAVDEFILAMKEAGITARSMPRIGQLSVHT
jgi:hypothetical protein